MYQDHFYLCIVTPSWIVIKGVIYNHFHQVRSLPNLRWGKRMKIPDRECLLILSIRLMTYVIATILIVHL